MRTASPLFPSLNSLDIYFINRPGMRNVQNWLQIAPAFNNGPSGGTYLRGVLDLIQQTEVGKFVFRQQLEKMKPTHWRTNDTPAIPVSNTFLYCLRCLFSYFPIPFRTNALRFFLSPLSPPYKLNSKKIGLIQN